MKRFEFLEEPLRGLKLIKSMPIHDPRGHFQRLYCMKDFEDVGLQDSIVNVNYSKTNRPGTIRGLHFQRYPSNEVKIVKCIKGAIYDVAVDIREGSPTFLKYYGVELNEKNEYMLFIPKGFAHGFQALEENSEIIYFVTEYYSSELESGLNPFDKIIDINWPLACECISEKDQNAQMLDPSFRGIRY